MAQAHTAFNPYGANDTGSRKMPMPMVLPTTRAVHVQNPRTRDSDAAVWVMKLDLLNYLPSGTPSGTPRPSTSGKGFPSSVKDRETEFRQCRSPVGGGPSGNTWPRWLPQRAHTSSTRTMP